jgi:serine/threonine-protein kinase
MTTDGSLLRAAENELPKRLFGYDVVEFIGQGAGSTIYAVSDPINHQVYALKHVIVKNEKQVRFVEQLVNEHEISQKVRHPYLRRTVEVKVIKPLFRNPTEAALIMELVDAVALENRPTKTATETVSVFSKVADALSAMHSQNVVHCDLKPNNILMCADGTIKVIDLGQACMVGTVKKRIQGTPDFISPEQVRCEPVDVRTDVYNFGATFYWGLTASKLPTLFTLKKGANSFLVDDHLAPPHTLNPRVPETLSNLVMECVRTNPAKRPADMAELSRRLEIISHGMQRLASQATAG